MHINTFQQKKFESQLFWKSYAIWYATRSKLVITQKGRFWVLKIFSRRGSDQNFPIKKDGLVKLEAYSKSGVSINNLSKVIILCLCVVFVLCSFIAFGILCVSQEELCLVGSNQEMYDFCKWVIFVKERQCELQ